MALLLMLHKTKMAILLLLLPKTKIALLLLPKRKMDLLLLPKIKMAFLLLPKMKLVLFLLPRPKVNDAFQGYPSVFAKNQPVLKLFLKHFFPETATRGRNILFLPPPYPKPEFQK